MSNRKGWTPERKTKQAMAVQQWKPWLNSTGPKSSEGKAIVAKNAFKGAKRPKHRTDMWRAKLALWLMDYGELLDRAYGALKR